MEIKKIVKKIEESKKEIENMVFSFLSEVPEKKIDFGKFILFDDNEYSSKKTMFSKIFIYNDAVFVEYKDSENESVYCDEIQLFSFDEIYSIVKAIGEQK